MKKIKVIIFTISLSIIASFIYDSIKNFAFLHTIKSIYNYLIEFLNIELKLWWVLLGLIIFICLFSFFRRLKSLPIKDNSPDFLSYVKDKFDFYLWKWDWRFSDYEKAWVIKDLTAHCPKCETPLIESGTFALTSYECPRCKSSYSKVETEEDIQTLIVDNAKRNLWGK